MDDLDWAERYFALEQEKRPYGLFMFACGFIGGLATVGGLIVLVYIFKF